MRTLLIATLGVGLATASAVDAQRMVQRGPGASFPQPGRGFGAPAPRPGTGFVPGKPGHGGYPGRPGSQWNGGGKQWNGGGSWNRHGQNGTWAWSRGGAGGGGAGWGGGRWQNQRGRWVGGWNAPGGWGAYTQPYVGWAVPSYWVQPGFAINDWSSYGLAQPPAGYGWSRYYDDAVLIDGRGSVYDTVNGIDWDGGYVSDGYAYDDRGYDDRGYRRDNGLGGAAIGAVVGGAAGAAIGGGVGSALIGAGVGAVGGYAIDRAEDRGRRGPPPPPPRPAPGYGAQAYGAGYGAPGYAPPPPGGTWVSPNGGTTVTTSGGYGYYGGGSTTTVVVQSAPVVTTTTTEIIEDRVTWSRPAKKIVKRRWRAPTKTICRC